MQNELRRELAIAARRELARRSLLDFTQYTFPQYDINWHHKAYAGKLDQFIRGEIQNLMVFMPPQHGKSEMSSRRLPAYILGLNPKLRIGIVSYNQTVASRFNRDVQRIINSEEYQSLFQATRLNNKKGGEYVQNADEFEIVGHTGSLVSVGVGGGLTSRTIDILIIDDLYKDAQEAWSETVRHNVQDWYDTVARTRLHNNSQQLIVFTRWHEEDLAGYLLSTEPEKWEVVVFPAIKIGEPNDIDPRHDGESLWESKHGLAELELIRKNNPVVFDSLYQQNPTPKEGLLFPSAEMKRFKREQIAGTRPDAIVSFCDVADEGDDSLCHPVGYLFGKNLYIVDVNFTQEPVEITQPLVAAMIDKHCVQKTVFESNNGGKQYAQEILRLRRGRTSISWQRTTQNKHTKILMESGIIKECCFFLVDEEQSGEYRKYFYELTHYPKSGKVKHDDAADGTTMLSLLLHSKPVATAGRIQFV